MEKEKSIEDYKDLIDLLTEEGEPYREYTVIPGKGLCALCPFIFTIGIITGITEDTAYEDRYCYPREYAADAIIALKTWDGKEHPPGNWVKYKGRKGEFTNKNFKQ